jgi:hypothetical protein
MKELSVTVTAGIGSERHNHDLEYRETLQHVHGRPDGVVEVLPYRPYQEQIDAAMRPHIQAYNEEVQRRYDAAWQRYKDGKIKSKPKKKDYQQMGFDYYTEHINDTMNNPHTGKVESVPMWRSLIIGIGDRDDRLQGRITEQQAREILTQVTKDFQQAFPDFLVLGCSIHLDEAGFYHAHLDYKPLYVKKAAGRGLRVGIGQEAALEHMGYEPEQSIINGRDKAPLLFNAFRNKVYRLMESAMDAQGLRLQYGVSEKKEPGKDSSKNQRLEVWQQTQDAAREMQHQKNIALDVLSQDKVSPEGYKQAMAAIDSLQATMAEVETSPHAVMRKEYRVSFKLFDQMKSVLQNLQQTIVHLMHQLNTAKEQVAQLQPFKAAAERAEKTAATWRDRYFEAATERQAWQDECERQRQFMSEQQRRDGRSVLDAYEAAQDAQDAAQSAPEQQCHDMTPR